MLDADGNRVLASGEMTPHGNVFYDGALGQLQLRVGDGLTVLRGHTELADWM